VRFDSRRESSGKSQGIQWQCSDQYEATRHNGVFSNEHMQVVSLNLFFFDENLLILYLLKYTMAIFPICVKRRSS